MGFRDRLLASLRAMQPVLDVPGVPDDLEELAAIYTTLDGEQRSAVLGNLAVLSLMKPVPEMPDPTKARAIVAQLVRRLEALA